MPSLDKIREGPHISVYTKSNIEELVILNRARGNRDDFLSLHAKQSELTKFNDLR